MWELQQTERVASWRRIENNEIELVFVKIFQNLCKRLCLVDTGNAAHDFAHECLTLLLHFFVHAFHGLASAGATAHETAEASLTLRGWIDL